MKKENFQDFDFEAFKAQAIADLQAGKSLTGSEGILTPIIKHFLESALDAEMNVHLGEEKKASSTKNRRNGKSDKQLKTAQGQFELETPRDRSGSFEPKIVKKRQVFLGDALEDQIIGMYRIGMSCRDIRDHILEMYGTQISADKISEITDKIIPDIRAWQSRPLSPFYVILWLDAMYYRIKSGSQVVTRCVYNVIGITVEGHKELLGMYIGEQEGAKQWLVILDDLQKRGLEDVLIACTDNLKGFAEAIESIFPQVEVQLCVVHQIRNALKYVTSADQKVFLKDLKTVYQAISKEEAEFNLLALEEKWAKKYPMVINSWQRNWDRLSWYFKYPQPIRKIIYTTNTIEGFHRQIRKITKTKGAFATDMALMKLLYLASLDITKKWSKPLPNWALTISQLAIMFEDRILKYLP